MHAIFNSRFPLYFECVKPTQLRMLPFLLLALLAALGGLSSCKSQDDPVTSIPQYEGYKLVWNDEFDGTSIDTSKWSHEVNARGGGNNELQYYTERQTNSVIDRGDLVIVSKKENYTGPEGTRNYTSARLRTVNKGDFLYGRIEVRAKLPKGQGIWPAIWMLPTDWEYGGWPNSGEIDIMEVLGHEPAKTYGTLHYFNTRHTFTGANFTLPAGDFSTDYHVFRVDWEPEEFRWYVDDSLFATQKTWASTPHPYPAPFNKRFHILLNVAVGGNWPGNPNETTVFPQFMRVDYVRVYQKDV